MPQIVQGSEVDLGGGRMLVRRVSVASNQEHEREMRLTPAQLAAWRGGELIQRAMPQLTPDEREFLMTGITPAEWQEHVVPKEGE